MGWKVRRLQAGGGAPLNPRRPRPPCAPQVDDAYGDDGGMQGLHLRDAKTGETRDLAVRGIFYGIGHTPNSGAAPRHGCVLQGAAPGLSWF